MFAEQPSAETRELLAQQNCHPGVSIHEAQRRPFGVPPAALLGALTLIALLAVLILAIAAQWLGAIIALGVFIGLIGLFIAAIRHDPGSSAARTARRSAAVLISTARFIAVAAGTWARAGIALLHIKQQRLRLKRQLRRQLNPLGHAVYRDNHAHAEELKAKAENLGHQLTQTDRQASAIIKDAREAVEEEKATAQPTQTLPAVKTETARRGDVDDAGVERAGPGKRQP